MPDTPQTHRSALEESFGQRLCQLADGQFGLRATLINEISIPTPEELRQAGGARVPASPDSPAKPDVAKATAKEQETQERETKNQEHSFAVIDLTASDETLDRYNEIIVASGWQLDNYRKNPVFQNSHKYHDVTFTLGKALTTEVRNKKLVQRIQFAVDINPIAKLAYDLYVGRYLNATSVGFIPLSWEDGKRSDNFRRKFTSQELLENSAVAVPANPAALQDTLKDAYQDGAVEKATLKEVEKLLRLHSGRSESADNSSSESDAKTGEAASDSPPSPNPNPQPALSNVEGLKTLAQSMRETVKSL